MGRRKIAIQPITVRPPCYFCVLYAVIHLLFRRLSTCRHLTCFPERPNAVCYLSKGKWPCLELCFKNRSSLVCDSGHDFVSSFLRPPLALPHSAQNWSLQKGIRARRLVLRRCGRYNIRYVRLLPLFCPHRIRVTQNANLVIQTSFFNTALPTSMPSSSDK
jgi:hypothetical protein